MVAKEYYTYAGNAGRNRRILTSIRDKILEKRRLPHIIPPDDPHNLTLLHVK